MQWLSLISVRRPVFATVLILVLVVVGAVGYGRLGVDKFPKIDFPLITIVTPYQGASPLAVESDVSQKIEEAVNTVNGLDTLTSVSTEGVSLVIAQFGLEVDPDQAAQDITEHIAGVLRHLPPGSRPEVRKADPDAAPVLVLSVKAPPGTSARDRTRFADKQVKQRIERLAGVGQVVILGGQERQINVHLDAIRLAAVGVSALEVHKAISSGNVNVPGGRIESGPTNTTLRVEGRALQAEQIGDIVVRQMGEHPVRVRDVAEVVDSEEDAETAASRNGTPAIALSVRKQSGTNTVAVVDSIREAVTELQAKMPPGYSVDVVRDNSEQIRTSAEQVLEHLVIGALLAALVVLLFLGSLRSTLIAAISIPVSIVSTFGLMMVAGFTLNLMTLLALALAVGIVIDDAIVVLENIYRFIEEKKMKPFPAAIAATKEIGLAVLATTLSLMAVFLPVAFMSGIVGRFLFSFGMTMAFAIGVSMIVAFTLTPMMAARMLAPPPPAGEERRRSWLERGSDFVYRPIERLYSAVLAFCLRHRWVVGLAIVGSCATMVPLAKQVGGDFLPPNDEAQFEVYIQTPEGTTLEATTLIAERLARKIRQYREVDSTLVTIADSDQRQSNVGRIYVRLTDPRDRVRHQNDVMEVVRNEVLPDVPVGTRVAAQQVNDFSIGGQNAIVSYVISGPELDKLERYGKRVLDTMKKVPGVVDLDSSLLDPVQEVTVRPDLDRAAMLGVDPGAITATLAVLVGGVEASTFEDRGDQYPIYLRAAERFRDDPSALSLIAVPSSTLGQVPLSDVVELGSGLATSKITRQSRERAVTITMNVSPGHSESTVVAALVQTIENLDMPAGYTAEPFGRSKEMAKMQGAFMFAIGLAVIFMYLVLAAQFESWLYPFIIMLSLPLTVPFAIISLVLTGGSLNIFSMLGLIVLFAMVKKNAILQVDHANGLRRQGLPRTEAVLAASRDRLRPILMTTFAFVAGMLPLVLSQGIGAGFSKAMASIVVGGQTLSLLLTLVAVPVIYTWFDDLARGARKLGARLRRKAPPDRGASEIGVVAID
ncbi:MAG: efflux RND transporter permease subunit [Deltaproteobacteria bacterium]|nr:efflux RND transporter permease subunit [Deltaproteobacteria bacterium]MDQ3300687.1 efflux RND transporter permease subunit [Myxococcota bacterium]